MSGFPGKLIVCYGINNLGKSTQAKLLVERLKSGGYQAEYLKYPIYELKPSGEILNSYLRLGNPFNLSPREAQIIYALNRDQYQEVLIAKLKAGLIVVAEDYKGTGLAWGLGAGVKESFLKSINSHLLPEDLVFLFDGERFKQAVENGHKHETDEDLMTKVRWAHLKLSEEYGWHKIQANQAIETIHEDIWEQTREFLEGKKSSVAGSAYSGFSAVKEILNVNHQALTPNQPILKFNYATTGLNSELSPTENDLTLAVEKIDPAAKLPQKAHPGDAAHDLYANDYYSLPPYGQALVSTGLKFAIPIGHVGLIWDKSGLAAGGITTLGGVIDANFRGEIKVIVKNLSEEIFNIVPGQKIAQILIQPSAAVKIKEENIDQRTDRQANGFGSSGQF